MFLLPEFYGYLFKINVGQNKPPYPIDNELTYCAEAIGYRLEINCGETQSTFVRYKLLGK